MDTIAAIATAPGQGGIGIIRISGPDAPAILKKVFISQTGQFPPWKLKHGSIIDVDGTILDDGLAVHMPGPNSFTGEDVVELHCHGAPMVLQMIMETVIRHGGRQAQRGEFTRRAFLNGKLDLSQAEAVAELIAAPSKEAARYGVQRLTGYLGARINQFREDVNNLRSLVCVALDFPEDEVPAISVEEFTAQVRKLKAGLEILARAAARARTMQQGATVVLAGAVNAGKSSILNTLSGTQRALVTDIPGTTRDFIEVCLDLDGLPVRIIDTAGFRDNPEDPVERLGVEKSMELIENADLVLMVRDMTILDNSPCALMPSTLSYKGKILEVYNKLDLALTKSVPGGPATLAISAKTGQNIDLLIQKIRSMLMESLPAPLDADAVAPNIRQWEIIEKAISLATELENALVCDIPFDLCVTHLDGISQLLDEILGLDSHEELLDRIFSNFCIGK